MVCHVVDLQARTGSIPQAVDVRPLIAELRRERRLLDRMIQILELERLGGNPVVAAAEPERGRADR